MVDGSVLSILILLGATAALFAATLGVKFGTAGGGGWVLRRILSLRYRVSVKGLEDLDLDESKGVLFLPNHPALIDPVIVMSLLLGRFRPRPLSDELQASRPLARQLIRLVDPITLPSLRARGRKGRSGVKTAIEMVIRCLNDGKQVLLYPAGRLYRSSRESLRATSAVQTIIDNASDVQVVLVRTTGLWGSSFSWAGGEAPSATANLKRNIFALLAAGLFFIPKREVTVELVRDLEIKGLGGRSEINRHLERFYNETAQPNTHVPYWWWRGRSQRTMPEPESNACSRCYGKDVVF